MFARGNARERRARLALTAGAKKEHALGRQPRGIFLRPDAGKILEIAGVARGLEPPFLGREDAVGQARAIAALYRSAEAGGRPVV